MTRYKIINIRTGEVIGDYANRMRAHSRADKLDLIYGAINYRVVPFTVQA